MYLKKFHFLFLIIILNTSISIAAICQNRTLNEIESEKETIEKSLEFTMNELQNINKDDLNDEYLLLKSHINSRIRLDTVLNEEIQVLQKILDSNKVSLDTLSKKIVKSEKIYVEVLKMLYRQKLIKNNWLYLLSSESLNSGVIKYRYTKQMENYARKNKDNFKTLVEEMNHINIDITQKIITINQNRNKHQRIIEDLKEEQENKEKLIAELKKNRKRVAQKLKIKENLKKKSAAAITSKTENQFSLEPYPDKMIIDSNAPKNHSFNTQKRKLSWPVDKGIVVEKFGKRPHDVVKNIWIENNGVGIRTSPGENIKSVFRGVIKQTPKIDESGYMIIIEHGDYLTSYFSIASIFVKKGDTVSEGQIIGQMSKSPTTTPTFNFEIWRGFEKLNPEHWLMKK